ncbi:unnamed protein product (macronuclear) [Paramecium tetraurelia]|uniref:Uncharacterized protein n=1 Tax=Paramecium tetraurelia TaxID=5888 RepID=A0BIW7_PARTE|nr:uncharacterized protein GSPATT00004857001 [Paramecium tetraurelia]CAK58484.1 unnamed protein product [Paramecium tetraurelia]|eukprot:XP_001425882.1 hypothetical protein (macronuclear) [Paramecium tetraurelia strain d4-2]
MFAKLKTLQLVLFSSFAILDKYLFIHLCAMVSVKVHKIQNDILLGDLISDKAKSKIENINNKNKQYFQIKSRIKQINLQFVKLLQDLSKSMNKLTEDHQLSINNYMEQISLF